MKGRLVPLLIIAVVASIAHLPALGAGYVLDDGALLVDNPYLRTGDGLKTLLDSELFAASGEHKNVPYYRPLSGALYWLSYQLLSANPMLQHGFNLLLHSAVAVLLGALLLRFGAKPVATVVLTLLLFAAHPATPEIVAYVGGRQDMMGWLVVLGGWLVGSAVSPTDSNTPWCSERGLFLLAVAITAGAALCREFFFCTPLLLLPLATLWRDKFKPRSLALLAGGSVGLLVVFMLRRAVGVSSFTVDLPGLGEVIELTAAVALRLLKLLFAPTDVAVDVTPARIGVRPALLLLGALLAATAASLYRLRSQSWRLALVSFGWATFWSSVILHVPVALKYNTLSDRYAYGVLLGASAAALALWEKVPDVKLTHSRLGMLLAAAGVACVIPITWARDLEWTNEDSLQRSMYARRPTDPQARLAEGIRLFSQGHFAEALPHCLAFAQAQPKSDRAGLCLGAIFLSQGKPREAAKYLEHYAFARPGAVRARITLFQAWFLAGDLQGVRRGLDYYLPMFPDAPDLLGVKEELERRQNRPVH